MLKLSVGLPGLEPGKAGPESAVLPLHHSPRLKCDAKVQHFLIKKNILPSFFLKKNHNLHKKRAVTAKIRSIMLKKEKKKSFYRNIMPISIAFYFKIGKKKVSSQPKRDLCQNDI